MGTEERELGIVLEGSNVQHIKTPYPRKIYHVNVSWRIPVLLLQGDKLMAYSHLTLPSGLNYSNMQIHATNENGIGSQQVTLLPYSTRGILITGWCTHLMISLRR